MPSWDWQAGLNEFQKPGVEGAESVVGERLACFGKGLGAGPSNRAGPVYQMREEGIQFVLDAGLEAGQHGHDENGKSQNALAEKTIGFETRLIEQFVRVEVVDKVDKNTLVLRSSW
jgi:hypothetical protein